MKKLISIVSMLLLFVAITVNAQHPKHQKKSVSDIVKQMDEQLNLSDDQEKRITEILEARKAKMQAAKAEGNKTNKADWKAARQETQAEIDKVLTADQRKKLDEHKKAQQKLQAEERVEKRVAHLKQELNLTDAQVAKIKPMIAAHHANMQKAKEKHAGNEEAMKTALKAERTRFKAELNKALTPEQQAKLKEMKQHKGKKGQGKSKH